MQILKCFLCKDRLILNCVMPFYGGFESSMRSFLVLKPEQKQSNGSILLYIQYICTCKSQSQKLLFCTEIKLERKRLIF